MPALRSETNSMAGVKTRSGGGETVARARRTAAWIRWPLLVAVGLLVVGLALGYAVHDPATGSGGDATASLYDFEDPTVLDIAGNNLAVMVLLVGGWVTLGALTVTGLLYNGFVLGTVVRTLVATDASLLEVLVLIVPHAAFELGGLVLAAAVAFQGTANVLRYLLARRATPVTRTDLRRATELLVVATVLIAGAAVVEVYVTPSLT